MRRKMGKITLVVVIFSLLMICLPASLQAAPVEEDQIEASIDAGLVFLASQQSVDGSWGWFDRVGHTGFAVLKMEDRAVELGYDPFDEDYIYSVNIIAGLNFIFSKAYLMDGKVYFYDTNYYHSVYETSVAMMAIAASNDPSREVDVSSSVVNTWTYEAVEQGALDYLEFAQNTDGGWGYYKDEYGTTRSDNSNTGYAVLGLIYAQNRFGLTISPSVKTLLSGWIDFIQNDPGTADDGWESDPDGGSGYVYADNWVNILKTGNLLFEMAFVGDTAETVRAQAAINYIERHWNDANMEPGWKGSYGYPWPIDNDGDTLYDEDPVDGIDNDIDGFIDEDPPQPHYQAMYTTMKGFEAMGIETINVGGEEVNWFDEFCAAIVYTQSSDGSWPYDYWAGSNTILATEWALLTLEKVVEIPVIPVFVDIKPGSWPNPINPKSKGVIPVAICGTDEFDVMTIDPATIQITTEDLLGETGVSPLRWSYEDVATPYTGEEGGGHEITGDGFIDLVFHFDTPEVVETLGLYDYAGTTIPLIIIGNLIEDEGGTPIRGQDFVWILDKEMK